MIEKDSSSKIKLILSSIFFTLVYLNVCNVLFILFNCETAFEYFIGYAIVLFLLTELLFANYGIYKKGKMLSLVYKNNINNTGVSDKEIIKKNRIELNHIGKLKDDFIIFLKGFKYCIPFFIVFLIIFFLLYFVGFLEMSFDITKLNSGIELTSGLSILSFFAVFVIKGFCDEVVARRWLQNRLYYYHFKDGNNKGIYTSIILSSLIFSLCHLAKLFIIPFDFVVKEIIIVFVSGIYFGIIYGKTKSIFLVGLLHGILEFFLRIEEICFGWDIEKLLFNRNYMFIFLIVIAFVILIFYSCSKNRIKEYDNKFNSYLDDFYKNN